MRKAKKNSAELAYETSSMLFFLTPTWMAIARPIIAKPSNTKSWATATNCSTETTHAMMPAMKITKPRNVTPALTIRPTFCSVVPSNSGRSSWKCMTPRVAASISMKSWNVSMSSAMLQRSRPRRKQTSARYYFARVWARSLRTQIDWCGGGGDALHHVDVEHQR